MIKKSTKVVERHAKFIEGDSASIVVKLNSYKDGDVEVDMLYINNSKVELEVSVVLMEPTDMNKVKVQLLNPLSTIISSYTEDVSLSTIESDIKGLLSFAVGRKGEVTHDYSIHTCHAKLIIGYFPKQNKPKIKG